MNKNKLIIAAALFLTPIAIFANGYTPQPEKSPFDGAFIGIGVSSVNLRENGFMETEATIPQPDSNQIAETIVATGNKTKSGTQNFGGTIFGGYGKVLDQVIYLGGEIFGRFTNNTSKYIESVGAVVNVTPPQSEQVTAFLPQYGKIHEDYSWGGYFKIGFLPFPRAMIYLMAGAENTKFTVKKTSAQMKYVAAGGSDADIANIDASGSNFSKSSWTFSPGIGLAIAVTKHFVINAQYTEAWYPSIKHEDSGTSTATIINGTTPVKVDVPWMMKTKVTPEHSVFTIGGAYYFNLF